VEHELETLIRDKLFRKDDATWKLLTGENGPFRTLYGKALAGFAFKFFDENTLNDVRIIRVVRNTFAHAKKLFDFDHRDIVAELLKAKSLSQRFRKELNKPSPDPLSVRAAYATICFAVSLKLTRYHTRKSKAAAYRIRQKLKNSPLGNAVIGSLGPMTPIANLGIPPLWFLSQQTGGQKRQPTPTLLGGLLSGGRWSEGDSDS
jgi:hypothetical protein